MAQTARVQATGRHGVIRVVLLLLALVPLFGCGDAVPTDTQARILLLGDSMMAANAAAGQGVADVIEAEYGQDVIDRSVVGARYFHVLPVSGGMGMTLTRQYRAGPWDEVVLNGGGNDLLFGCGCGQCGRILDRLVSSDGRAGAIPSFVATLRRTGARVIYVGYLRNPGTATPIKACGPAGNELDRRLAVMAQFDAGVTFLSMADLVPYGDWSYHQIDRIHPSAKGSKGIADRIVAHLRKVGPQKGTEARKAVRLNAQP